MGVMEQLPVEPGRLIVTPHPILLDGQRNEPAELRPGESLYAFLARNVPDFHGDSWEVAVGGVIVPAEHWHRVKPKHGQCIEARGAVKKQALQLVALIAISWFAWWAAPYLTGTWGVLAGANTALVAGGITMAGSALINYALAPKLDTPIQQQPDSVYAIGAARNRARPYEPVPLLFGVCKIVPDLASNPYTWYQGNDQHVGFVLNAGINVGRIEQLKNGDTDLTSYEGVAISHSGYAQMPDDPIPQYTNADTTDGGTLESGVWVQRTTSPNTVRIMVGIEYILGGTGTSGKDYYVDEQVQVQYRAVGATTWQTARVLSLRNNDYDVQRRCVSIIVPEGQYEVQVQKAGLSDYSGANTQKGDFTWTTLTSVQADAATYRGLARTALTVKATGQLNGPMDEINGIAYAAEMPVWNGTAWVTATDETNGLSNPGAQILQYARGFHDEDGALIAGLGWMDSQIDLPAFQAFMLHCAANGYTYDYYLKSARSHREVLDAIAAAGFGRITLARGKLSIVWAADAQPIGGVVNMATIKKGQFQVDYQLANAADGIEYTYLDRSDWQTKTLRVPAPGVTTMLNPARITGEGITSEARAAEMARYHLAQHLYQYKTISYATDLEYLSYRPLSIMQLQHDLTRWDHGGRVIAAEVVATDAEGNRTVRLTLDEPVPSGATPHIGLRIPGENAYRVFKVQALAEESDTLTLAEPWPADAALPGDPGNPAHDTLWVYGFTATPGYRVRVVGMEPESRGARVTVVPESPEFWAYVKTGTYEPPAVNPNLPQKPTVSNLQVTERKVIQGDTTFTELQVAFDVTGGKMDFATVVAAPYVDGVPQELVEVAQTKTRVARWRIPAAGTYAIVVRPYDANGIVGNVASTTYTTIGAEVPPPAFDYFTLTELDGGVRKYAFGYTAETIQAPDYAGAEIRYITGTVATPDWATMTPLGDDGFFTSAVEMVIPPAGTWTFACRPRNTSGLLGPAKVVTATLTENLGEITNQTGAEIAQIIEDQLVDAQNLADEIIARQQTDAELAIVKAQVGDIMQADEWVQGNEYPSGDLVQSAGKLYRALQDVPAGTALTDTAYWEVLGNYSSLGDAVAAHAAAITLNTSDIEAVSTTVQQHAARMPTGTGKLSTEAALTAEQTARANADSALGTRTSTIEARMPTGTDKLANEARVLTAEQARASADEALSGRIGTVEARMPSGSGQLATSARVDQVDQARVDGDAANAAAITQVDAKLMSAGRNLIGNPTGANGTEGWENSSYLIGEIDPRGQPRLRIIPDTYGVNRHFDYSVPGAESVYTLSGVITNAAGNTGNMQLRILALNSSGSIIGSQAVEIGVGVVDQFLSTTYTTPPGTAFVAARVSKLAGTTGSAWFRKIKLENSDQPTPYSEEAANAQTASVTQALRADVDSVTGQVNSSYTLAVNANDKVAGLVAQNDGTVSDISFLFDNVNFASSDGVVSITDGRLIVRSNGYMSVTGRPFGTDGTLTRWMGPDVGSVANCSRANGKIYETNTGDGYFGGVLVSGSLDNRATGSSLASNAQAEIGPFTTNGGSKVVTVGYSLTNFGYLEGDVASTYDGDAITAQLVVERSYAGGAWAQIGTVNASGIRNATYLPEFGRTEVQYSCTGSITTTDTYAGTGTFAYRARLVSRTVGYPMALITQPAGSQTSQGLQLINLSSVEG